MAEVKVLAGDFAANGTPASYIAGFFLLPAPDSWIANESYSVRNDVVTLELATESGGVKVFGAAAWGAAGALLAGPLGLVAGAVLGGKAERVAFVAEFCDGKKLMAQCDKKVWTELLAERFKGPDPKLKPRGQRNEAAGQTGRTVFTILLLIGACWAMFSCAVWVAN